MHLCLPYWSSLTKKTILITMFLLNHSLSCTWTSNICPIIYFCWLYHVEYNPQGLKWPSVLYHQWSMTWLCQCVYSPTSESSIKTECPFWSTWVSWGWTPVCVSCPHWCSDCRWTHCSLALGRWMSSRCATSPSILPQQCPSNNFYRILG